jgi:hypothetical protein
MTKDLSLLDLTAQADLVRRGKLSPLELVDAAIERAEALESSLNAIVSRQFERARAEAASPDLPQGPFSGVPILLKDLGAYLDGDPVYCGMGALKQADWRIRRSWDSPPPPSPKLSVPPQTPGSPATPRAARAAARQRPWRLES